MAEGFADRSAALSAKALRGPSRNVDKQIYPIFVPSPITSELHPHGRREISLLLLPLQQLPSLTLLPLVVSGYSFIFAPPFHTLCPAL